MNSCGRAVPLLFYLPSCCECLNETSRTRSINAATCFLQFFGNNCQSGFVVWTDREQETSDQCYCLKLERVV